MAVETTRIAAAGFAAWLLFGFVAPAGAQRGAIRPNGAGATPAEIQQMFDAYALIQAQDQLAIDDEHYPQFLTRFKALQEIRQRSLAERTRRLAELRRLLAADGVDGDQLRERLQQLDALDRRTATAVQDAYAKVDEVLTPVQQARFRIFEEQMERRKLDLLTLARQANRRQPQQPPQ